MSFKLLNTTVVSDMDTLQGDTQVNLTVGSTPALTVTDQPPYTQFDFVSNSSGGLLCNFKVPQSESPFDMRIAVGNPSGNYIENKGDLLFIDSTGTLAGQELLIRDSSNPGGAGIALPNSTVVGYSPSTLNVYEKVFIDLTVTGLTGVSIVNCTIVRIGDNIGLDWSDSGVGQGQGTLITLSGIPPRFIPSGSWRHVSVPVKNNTVEVIGVARVTTNGTIEIFGGPLFTPFTNNQQAQFYGSGVSYCV